jgi:hypothetical protein
MNEKIKNWYLKNFSSDDIGEDIKENITFAGLFDCLDSYKCVYEFLGVDDSIIRERVFERLADIMDVEYEYIYNQWLLGTK